MPKTETKRAKAGKRAKNREPKTLSDLVADPKNARRHTERNLAMIDASLEAVGAARSIVIDEGARVLAGNATVSRALARGLKLRVVDVDGDTVVAVRRRGLTEHEKIELALYDNRAAELAEWDPDVLGALRLDGADLDAFFQPGELDALPAAEGGLLGGPDGPVAVGQAGVIVLCENEVEQQRVYEDLTGRGLTCKVVNT